MGTGGGMKEWVIIGLVTVIVVFIAFMIAGSCRNAAMREAFPPREIRVLTDSAGNRWAVEHHLGVMYTVKPLEEE